MQFGNQKVRQRDWGERMKIHHFWGVHRVMLTYVRQSQSNDLFIPFTALYNILHDFVMISGKIKQHLANPS